MSTMLILALVLNVVVLIPVCFGLMTDAAWVRAAYGSFTPARGILLSIYLAILIASAALLWFGARTAVITLLGLQIAYKLTTPWTARSLRNPVVLSNLLIAAFHSVAVLVS